MLAVALLEAPLVAVEGVLAVGLRSAGPRPRLASPLALPLASPLASPPELSRAHRALWAAIEGGAWEVEPVSAAALLGRFLRAGERPTAFARGEVMAMALARAWLSRAGARRRHLEWHLATLSLGIWLTRTASAAELTAQLGAQASLGRGAVGIEEAAHVWFDTRPEALSWAQAALLAALESAPAALDPRCAPEQARRRRSWVLSRLEAAGAMTPLERGLAELEPLLSRVEACPRAQATGE